MIFSRDGDVPPTMDGARPVCGGLTLPCQHPLTTLAPRAHLCPQVVPDYGVRRLDAALDARGACLAGERVVRREVRDAPLSLRENPKLCQATALRKRQPRSGRRHKRRALHLVGKGKPAGRGNRTGVLGTGAPPIHSPGTGVAPLAHSAPAMPSREYRLMEGHAVPGVGVGAGPRACPRPGRHAPLKSGGHGGPPLHCHGLCAQGSTGRARLGRLIPGTDSCGVWCRAVGNGLE